MEILDQVRAPAHWLSEKRCWDCTCGKLLNHERISADVKLWMEMESKNPKSGAEALGISVGYLKKLLSGEREWPGKLALKTATKVYNKAEDLWTIPLNGAEPKTVAVEPKKEVVVAPVRKAGEPWREVKYGEMVLSSGKIVRMAAGLGEKPQADGNAEAAQPDGNVQ